MSIDRKTRKRDLILIGLLLLISALMVAFVLLRQNSGKWVVVSVDGVQTARYSLEQNGTYSQNGGTNQLTIRNGAACMSEAECPDHLCVEMGEIRYSGQMIVCLPNRVFVTIEGVQGDVDLYIG